MAEQDLFEMLARYTGETLTPLDLEFLGRLARTGYEVTEDTLEEVQSMSEEDEEDMMRSLELKEASHWAAVDAVTVLQASTRKWLARR